MTIRMTLAIAAIALFAAKPGAAAPILFTNAAAFNAAIAGANVTTDGFSSLPASQTISTNVGSFNNVATVGGVTLRSSLPVVSGTEFNTQDRFIGANFGLVSTGRFAFEFPTASIFGISIDPETAGSLAVSLGGLGLGTVMVPATASFLGVIDTSGGFNDVTLTRVGSNTGFVNFDNLARGSFPVAVPEPATIGLFSLAVLGLAGLRRRRGA